MRWGKVDIKELYDLKENIERFQKVDRQKAIETALKEIAQTALKKVIKRTPVGKKPKFDAPKTIKVTSARGKKRVFLTKEGAILKQYWDGYKGGTLRRAWQVSAVIRAGNTYNIVIYNTVQYASYVEYGHVQTPGRYVPAIGKCLKVAWVEGKYMLTLSMREVEARAPRRIQKQLEQALEEVFGGD